jgi:hypothetical protein
MALAETVELITMRGFRLTTAAILLVFAFVMSGCATRDRVSGDLEILVYESDPHR